MGFFSEVDIIMQEGLTKEEAIINVQEGREIYRTSLYSRIKNILEQNNGFMDAEFLKQELNDYKYYQPNIKEKDILLEVLKYSNDFYYIDGLVIDTKEEVFQKIKKYNDYIKNLLSPYFNKPDIQYIVIFLFFYKKLTESDRLSFNHIELENFMFEDERKILIINNLKRFQEFYNFEINLVDSFIFYLENIKSDILDEIFFILNNLNFSKYSNSDFSKIFEYLIDKNIENSFTNKSMQRLMLSFFDLKDRTTIFNPFGGLGGLVKESFNKNSNISIQYNEINNRTLQLGFMTLFLNGNNNFQIKNDDSFNSYHSSQKYDYVITELPLAKKFNQNEFFLASQSVRNSQVYLKSKDSILYYVMFSLLKINNRGKAIFNVPTGFLFNSSSDYIRVRKYLIENDLIEAIINLPSGTMYHSGINTSLLLINFNKSEKNKIKIINAQLLYESKPKNREVVNESILDIDSIMDSYHHETKDSFFIDIKKISKKDYRLDSNIFQKEIFELYYDLEEGKSKYLKDLVTIKKGKNFDRHKLSNQGEFPIVKIQNLHNDVLDLYINENDTFEMLQNIQSGDIISEECILIAAVGEQLKPTIFRPSNKLPNIFITTNIIVLIPRNDVSVEYLYYQMYTKIVTEQIKNLTSGSIRTFLTISSISELIIPYVELQEQKNFTNNQKANIIASQRAELETKLKLIGYKEEIESKESDIVRTLTHQLRPILSNIYFEAENLKEIMYSNNLENMIDKNIIMPTDPEAKKPKINNLENIITIIYNDSKKLHDSLDVIDNVMGFKLEQNDFKMDNLNNFFKDYIDKQKKDYEISLKGYAFNIEFNSKALTELLNELLLNAERHAFIDIDKPKITFLIKKNDKQGIAIIEYYNSGKKFNVSLDNYINAFEKQKSSKGSGIGGNLVYRIIKAHKGELYLQDSKEGFKFYIEIPLKQNIEDK
ncbi:N-6 DNA methylase [Aliarcobacter butzleri]|uniref:N-6 DNA methylase n=1 Tax=Aliarcobacter TaxID=2321111 RepID=UPI00263E3BC7|nr:N-6 DNA methylase [Aliarcobacter butzleri]MDN5078860.1 N-6 DNA methylase [Aliarcobacter butzleri]MDN5119749.1 N-6 DNA methylase [Aliarcobacter butzleri]